MRRPCSSRRRRLTLTACLIASIACFAAPAPVMAALPNAPQALPQLWGVQVDRGTLKTLSKRRLRRLRDAGATLVAVPALGARGRARLAIRGRRARLRAFAPANGATTAAAPLCAALEGRKPGSRCAVQFGSAVRAMSVPRQAGVDLMLVRVTRLPAFRRLNGSAGRRVAGVLDIRRRGYRPRRWAAAIRAARRDEGLDLVVRPVGRGRGAALDRFARQLGKLTRGSDRKVPAVPRNLSLARAASGSASMTWRAARDNRKVVAYGLYRDGRYVGRTKRRSHSFVRLGCRAHVLAVDAVDAAGNRSRVAFTRAAPTGCQGSGPATFTTANLWVDPDGGSCTRSPTREDHVNETACGSLDAANDQCQSGDVVLVKGGDYAGRQDLNGSNGRTSHCIVHVASGERALMGRLSLEAVRWLWLRGMESTQMGSDSPLTPENRRALWVTSGSEDVVVENVRYGSFGIMDSRRVTLRGNDFGPCHAFDRSDPGASGYEGCPNGPIQYCDTTLSCTGYNEGHVIEGNVIHDFGCDDSFFNGVGSDDCHHECMYVSYASNLTVRGNVFRNCANGGNIFHTFSNGGGTFTAHFGFRDYTIENNVFEQSCNNRSAPCGGRLDGASGLGHCNIYGAIDLTRVTIRFNTFIGGSMFDLATECSQAPGSGLQIYGNLLKRTSTSCPSSGTVPQLLAYNVWSGNGTCGTNAINVGPTLAGVIVSDVNGGNPHLRGAPGSTVADGFVPVTVAGGCPATDVDGQPRPTSGACDAGADER